MRLIRLGLAFVVLAAIAAQFYDGLDQPGFSATNFFSFFTIISNLFAATVFVLISIGVPSPQHRRDSLRGAVTFYLLIVGLVFAVLLADVDLKTIPWVNTVLHYVMPVAVAIDWVIEPPETQLRTGDAALWFPLLLVYIVYTLLRGAFVHWYPYPFLNVDAIGYGSVGVYLFGMATLSVAMALAVVSIGNTLRNRRPAV